MDRQGAENLKDAVEGNYYVADFLVRLIRKTAWTLPADPLLWDMLTIAVCYQRSLKLAKGAIPAQLAWSRRFCSSLVDEAVYHREFLFGTVLDAITLNLVLNGQEAQKLRAKLLAGGDEKLPVIVAYMDILGQTKQIKNNEKGNQWVLFSKVSRYIEMQCRHRGLSSYYWRSADTYYVVGSVENDEGKDAALKALAVNITGLLLDIQNNIQLVKEQRDEEKWYWQIGVAVGEAVVIGDILLPDIVSTNAAKLMGAAKAKEIVNDKYKSGLILADREFNKLLKKTKYEISFSSTENKPDDNDEYLKNQVRDIEKKMNSDEETPISIWYSSRKYQSS
jgi:hypothetical protein